MPDIANGVVHQVSPDLKKALLSNDSAREAWESITPLARNEWICWVESVKKAETRTHHIQRLIIELGQGKRRPCCWLGCTHRTDKAMSASQKFILSRQTKKSQT